MKKRLWRMRRKGEERMEAVSSTDAFDTCVLCGKATVYRGSQPISLRQGYVEGVGQLCPICYRRVYIEKDAW